MQPLLFLPAKVVRYRFCNMVLACVLVQSYDMNTTGHLCNKKLLAACMESQRDRLCQGSQLVCWHGWCKAWRVSQDPKEQAEVCRNDLTLIDLDLQCT